MSKVFTVIFSLLSLTMFAQGNHPQTLQRDTIPEKISIEKKDTKNLVISQADTEYLNAVDDQWAKDLNQSLLYNNYDVNEDQIISTVDEDVLRKRLEELGTKTPLDVSYSPILQTYINKYLKMGHSMSKVMGLAEYYFPLFEARLAKYNIPLEIKYLAIVESRLNPRIGSNKGAIGLWQFILPTGKMYGLEINSFVDERMDPFKSTEAACIYLEKHYKMYGDWYLAMAAYNAGAGNINKAITRSGGQKNYWNVRPYLPKETQGYVPTFIAMMYMFEYADKHNLKPSRLDVNINTTDTVMIKKKLSFSEISRYVGIPVEKIEFLNPQYKLDIIPFRGDKQYPLRLPQKSISTFVSQEKTIYASTEQVEVAQKQPTVTAGESFTTVTAAISAPAATPKPKPVETPKPVAKVIPKEKKQSYKVKRGDYLALIASMYEVEKSQIIEWNDLKSQALLVGQNLTIYSDKIPEVKAPVAEKPVVAAKTTKTQPEKPKAEPKVEVPNKPKVVHKIKSGETLGKIAGIYGVTMADIQKWNKLKTTYVYPGQSLDIYTNKKVTADKTSTTAKKATEKEDKKEPKKDAKAPVFHSVKSGETLYSLAKKYGVTVDDIKKTNGLKSESLKLNQKLLIKK